jgi:GABA permease
MPRRLLIVITTEVADGALRDLVRSRAGDDAEMLVVAPASEISRLDWLTNAEDDARADAAAERAEAASEAAPAEQAEAHVGDVDPLQAIEDGLRMFPADEVVVLTEPDEEANWLESGLGEEARERFSVPVTHLVTR